MQLKEEKKEQYKIRTTLISCFMLVIIWCLGVEACFWNCRFYFDYIKKSQLTRTNRKPDKGILLHHWWIFFNGSLINYSLKTALHFFFLFSSILFMVCVPLLIQIEFLIGTFAVFDKARGTSYCGKSLTILYNCFFSVSAASLPLYCMSKENVWPMARKFLHLVSKLELTLLHVCKNSVLVVIYLDQVSTVILF